VSFTMSIKDWAKTFEQGSESKRLKKGLRYVTLPCGKPSAGIAALAKEGVQGMQAFAVFIRLVQIAATFDAEQRGTFPDDYTPETFATFLFMDVAEFEKAANLLVKVGWIENWKHSGEIAGEFRKKNRKRGKIPLEERRGEERRLEEIRGEENIKRQTRLTEYPKPFVEFWSLYPRKVNKKAALKAWDKATNETPAEQIIGAAEMYAASDIAADGEFLPHPATWLNKGGYLDDPAEWERREPKSKEQKRQEANFEVLANVSKIIDQRIASKNGQAHIHATNSDYPKRISDATKRPGQHGHLGSVRKLEQ